MYLKDEPLLFTKNCVSFIPDRDVNVRSTLHRCMIIAFVSQTLTSARLQSKYIIKKCMFQF